MKTLLSILFLLFAIQLCAKVYEAGPIKVEVIAVYDGDTIKCNVPAWPAIIGEKIRVRLKGINTAEVGEDGAKDAQDFLSEKIAKAKVVELRSVSRDKYFRLLAELWIDGENASTLLMQAGLAAAWNGQGEKPIPKSSELLPSHLGLFEPATLRNQNLTEKVSK